MEYMLRDLDGSLYCKALVKVDRQGMIRLLGNHTGPRCGITGMDIEFSNGLRLLPKRCRGVRTETRRSLMYLSAA
jgi:hypothetical protein